MSFGCPGLQALAKPAALAVGAVADAPQNPPAVADGKDHKSAATPSGATPAAASADAPAAAPTAALGPLVAHIRWFATAEGKLTAASMTAGHAKLGVKDGIAIKVQAIQAMLRAKFPDTPVDQHTVEQLMTIENPSRTGIWTAKGELDVARFDAIVQEACTVVVPVGGGKTTQACTMATLEPILKRAANKSTAAAIKVLWFIPYNVSWQQVTKGSFDEVFLYLADARDPATKAPAVTVAQLRKIYSDPAAAWAERAGALPSS